MFYILVLSVGGTILELGLKIQPFMAPFSGSESGKRMRNVQEMKKACNSAEKRTISVPRVANDIISECARRRRRVEAVEDAGTSGRCDLNE